MAATTELKFAAARVELKPLVGEVANIRLKLVEPYRKDDKLMKDSYCLIYAIQLRGTVVKTDHHWVYVMAEPWDTPFPPQHEGVWYLQLPANRSQVYGLRSMSLSSVDGEHVVKASEACSIDTDRIWSMYIDVDAAGAKVCCIR